MPQDTLLKPAVCIIVLRDALIGMDLSATIADARPGFEVLWVKTSDEAVNKLSAGLRIAAAFIDVAREEFVQSALAARVALDEALLVFVGPDSVKGAVAQLRDRNRVLSYPFSADDVLDVIADLYEKAPDELSEARIDAKGERVISDA